MKISLFKRSKAVGRSFGERLKRDRMTSHFGIEYLNFEIKNTNFYQSHFKVKVLVKFYSLRRERYLWKISLIIFV